MATGSWSQKFVMRSLECGRSGLSPWILANASAEGLGFGATWISETLFCIAHRPESRCRSCRTRRSPGSDGFNTGAPDDGGQLGLNGTLVGCFTIFVAVCNTALYAGAVVFNFIASADRSSGVVRLLNQALALMRL